MLIAEAVRLAAIEVLCPTNSIENDLEFPTLAGINVLDSKEIEISQLGEDLPFTPVLALYTSMSQSENRSGDAGGIEFENTCVLEVVGELAVVATDPDNNNEEFVDAMAGDDPDARLVLAAMISQVRYLLEEAESGSLFRKFAKAVVKVEEEPFGVPNLGLRWQRVIVRFTLAIGNDCFDEETGNPVSLVRLAELLPAESYAIKKINELLLKFTPVSRNSLVLPDVMQGDVPNTILDRKDRSE